MSRSQSEITLPDNKNTQNNSKTKVQVRKKTHKDKYFYENIIKKKIIIMTKIHTGDNKTTRIQNLPPTKIQQI